MFSTMQRQQITYLIAFLIAMTLPEQSIAQSQTLSPLALFSRCYAQLTGLPLPLNHSLRPNLIAGTLTGEVACANLMAKANLNSATFQPAADAEGTLVLRQMNSFHRTWFSGQLFEQMQAFDQANSVGTMDLYDSTEPALAITYALFAPNASDRRYENILKATSGFYALRTYNASASPSLAHLLPSRRLGNMGSATYDDAKIGIKKQNAFQTATPSTSDSISFTPVQVGELTGIRPENRSASIGNYAPNIKYLTATNVFVPAITTENAVDTPGMKSSLDLLETQGGGILGLPSFMMINWGHESGRLSDGSLKLPRRWVEATLSSLLCKELPVVRESDTPAFVDNGAADQIAPFRRVNSCVQCHATMDQFASIGRNLLVSGTDYGTRTVSGKYVRNSRMMGQFNASVAAPFQWSSTPVTDFHKMSPTGKLFMRLNSGELLNRDVTGIADTGAALTQLDDFYQCAAKRYFQYFTAIKVQLYDRGDPRFASITQSLSEDSIKQRKFVEKLARELKTHQSIQTLVQSILQSEYYTHPSYRKSEDQP